MELQYIRQKQSLKLSIWHDHFNSTTQPKLLSQTVPILFDKIPNTPGCNAVP